MVQYMESGMPQGATCKRFGCRILHNNWTTGGIGKLRRFIDHGFWYYDTDRMMCLHHWDKTDRPDESVYGKFHRRIKPQELRQRPRLLLNSIKWENICVSMATNLMH